MRKHYVIFILFLFSVQISLAQNVGIGTNSPSEKLQVAGNIKADTLKSNKIQLTPDAGINKILTSDSNGNASWQIAPGRTVLNGLTNLHDTIHLGGRLLESTALNLSGQYIAFGDNDDHQQENMLSIAPAATNITLSSTPVTQSFLATAYHTLAGVEFYLNSFPSTTVTVVLLNEQGIQLATTSHLFPAVYSGWYFFSFSNTFLTSGQQYRFAITGSSGTQLFTNNTNPYADGVSSISPSTDIALQLYSYSEINLFSVSKNEGVRIHSSLTLSNGTEGSGKVLVSDLNGRGTWQSISTQSGGWSTNGNTGIATGSQFLGTTDNKPLQFRTNNQPSALLDAQTRNAFWGYKAGGNNTGTSNTAIGDSALTSNNAGVANTAIGRYALASNTTGNRNIAIGHAALFSNTVKNNLIAIGDSALYKNSTGANSLHSIMNTGIGTNALKENISGFENTAVGAFSMENNTSGMQNTATGVSSLRSNTTGIWNTANGWQSLFSNRTGNANTAMGYQALNFADKANYNTAFGFQALLFDTTGNTNTAIGNQALFSNRSGSGNVAIGNAALLNNKLESGNVAIGDSALYSYRSLTGLQRGKNVAIGSRALFSATDGDYNLAVGGDALLKTTIGANNTAVGFSAFNANTTGNGNTSLGFAANSYNTTGSGNTALGYFAMYWYFSNPVTGDNNIAVGYFAGTDIESGSNNVIIGATSQPTSIGISNQVRLGNNNTTTAIIKVPWTISSDRRFKEQVRDLPFGLDLITQLRPVDYMRTDNKKGDNGAAPETLEAGFIAQEVEQTLINLGYPQSGMILKTASGYGMRYNDLLAPMVKAIQQLNQQLKESEDKYLALLKRLEALENSQETKNR